MTLNGVSRSPRVKLSMVDRDVVKKFADIIGGGNYFEHHVKNPKHKINSLGMHRQRQKLYE